MTVSFKFDSGKTSMWADKVTAELPALGAAGMRAAVREGARILQAEARQAAPYRSGGLSGSIVIEQIGATARIGPTAPYARRIELGMHSKDRLGRSYHERGHPYMSPAARKASGELMTIFRANVTAALT